MGIIANSSSIDALRGIISSVDSAAAFGRGYETNIHIAQLSSSSGVCRQLPFQSSEKYIFLSTKRRSGRKRLKLSEPDSKGMEMLTNRWSKVHQAFVQSTIVMGTRALRITHFGSNVPQGWIHAGCDNIVQMMIFSANFVVETARKCRLKCFEKSDSV